MGCVWKCFIIIGLCRMGILVIITTIIPKSFWIIICHRSNFISKSFKKKCLLLSYCLYCFNVFVCLYLFVYLTPFQCVFWFVCLTAFECFFLVCLYIFVCFTPFHYFFHLYVCILLWILLMNRTFIDILSIKSKM